MEIIPLIFLGILALWAAVHLFRITYRTVTFDQTAAAEAILMWIEARKEREIWQMNHSGYRRSNRTFQRLLRQEKSAKRRMTNILSGRLIVQKTDYDYFVEDNSSDLKPVS